MSKPFLVPYWVYIIIGVLLGILSVSHSAFLGNAGVFLALIDLAAVLVAAIAAAVAAFVRGVRGALAGRLALVCLSFALVVYCWHR